MSDLTSVELSKRLTSVDDYAFYQCDSLESIELPSSITSVGTHVLTGCTSLQKIKTELTSNYHLGNFFSNYGDLSYLNVPVSLTTVEVTSGTVVPKKFFYGLETLTDITFKEEITEIGESAFAYCKILVCPSSVRKIGANAFEGLGKIDDTVSLPEGLEQIGDMAFWGTYFKTINLPNTLNNIGISVFGATQGNSQLKTINFNGTKAKWISFAGEKPSNYSWASDLNYGYKIYCTDAYYTSSIYSSECVWTNY